MPRVLMFPLVNQAGRTHLQASCSYSKHRTNTSCVSTFYLRRQNFKFLTLSRINVRRTKGIQWGRWNIIPCGSFSDGYWSAKRSVPQRDVSNSRQMLLNGVHARIWYKTMPEENKDRLRHFCRAFVPLRSLDVKFMHTFQKNNISPILDTDLQYIIIIIIIIIFQAENLNRYSVPYTITIDHTRYSML
jgi:hypothetical protein